MKCPDCRGIGAFETFDIDINEHADYPCYTCGGNGKIQGGFNMKIKLEEIEHRTIEIAGVDQRDHPKYVDAYASFAVWKSTGITLSDDELGDLNAQYTDYIQALAYLDSVSG